MRDEMKSDLLSFIPSLRAFAFCLTQDRTRADDILHSSLIEICARHAGKKGLVLKVAAFKTVRRRFLRQAVADPMSMQSFAWQRITGDHDAFRIRFTRLPRTEREAISLIEVWGFRPPQAAEICECDRETINRRVHMARCHLTARSSRSIPIGAFRADTAAVHATAG